MIEHITSIVKTERIYFVVNDVGRSTSFPAMSTIKIISMNKYMIEHTTSIIKTEWIDFTVDNVREVYHYS
jgi:hypothetical protein